MIYPAIDEDYTWMNCVLYVGDSDLLVATVGAVWVISKTSLLAYLRKQTDNTHTTA